MDILKANLAAIAFGLMALTALLCDLSGWGWFLVPCVFTLHSKSED